MRFSGLIFSALFLACMLSLFIGGCNTAGCLENKSSVPLAEFYSSGEQKAVSITGIRIHGIGAPGDSAVVNGNAAQAYLPLRSSHDMVKWCISYAQASVSAPEFNDTLTMVYSSQPYFASQECGAMYTYHFERVSCTTHLIDSVAILDSLVTNVDIPQLRIYFRTMPAEPEIPEQPDEDEGEGGEDEGADSGEALPEEGGEQQ